MPSTVGMQCKTYYGETDIYMKLRIDPLFELRLKLNVSIQIGFSYTLLPL